MDIRGVPTRELHRAADALWNIDKDGFCELCVEYRPEIRDMVSLVEAKVVSGRCPNCPLNLPICAIKYNDWHGILGTGTEIEDMTVCENITILFRKPTAVRSWILRVLKSRGEKVEVE